MSDNSNLFLSIGKPIKDEYGRTVGKVASFALTPSGKFDAVYIQFDGGQFSKQPLENLKFEGEKVTFISKIKSQANNLCDQIPLIWRKDQALRDLAEKRKISPDLYQELHKNFDGILAQLKEDAQVLMDEAACEIGRCEKEMKALSYAVVNLELEHEIGQISEEAYKTAFAMLQENIKLANTEKSDIETMRSKLSSFMLGDSITTLPKIEEKTEEKIEETASPTPAETTSKPSAEKVLEKEPAKVPDETTELPETPEESPDLPEPPVVVYVKEIGKAGI